MNKITAIEAATGTFGLPTWIINNDEIRLCEGHWIIENGEHEYVPVLVNGVPKLMRLDIDRDSDGTFHSFWYVDEVPNSEWGREVKIGDYLTVALHIGNS